MRAQHAARPSTRLASAGQTRIFCSSRLEPRVWLVLVVKAFEIDRTSEKLNQGRSFGIRAGVGQRRVQRDRRFTLAACKGHRDLGSVL